MAENQNPKLGTVRCPAGGVADVYQTRKRGRHFYTRCECCGLMQGTGQKRQQYIWDNAEFLPGVTVHKPANVEDAGKGEPEQTGGEQTGGKLAYSAPEPDFDPAEEPEEPGQEGENENKRPIRTGLAALGVTLLAVGAGLWMS